MTWLPFWKLPPGVTVGLRQLGSTSQAWVPTEARIGFSGSFCMALVLAAFLNLYCFAARSMVVGRLCIMSTERCCVLTLETLSDCASRALAFWVPLDQCLQLSGLHFPFAEASGQWCEGMSCGVWRTRVQHVEQQAKEGEGCLLSPTPAAGLRVYSSYLLCEVDTKYPLFPHKEREAQRSLAISHLESEEVLELGFQFAQLGCGVRSLPQRRRSL